MIAEVPERIGRGRPTNTQLSDRLGRAREVNTLVRAENRALLDEVAALGRRLITLGTTLEFGIHGDRDDLVAFVRADVDRLGRSCLRKAGAS